MTKNNAIETTEMAIDKSMAILKKTGHYTAEIINVEYDAGSKNWQISAENKTKKIDMEISKIDGELTKFNSVDRG